MQKKTWAMLDIPTFVGSFPNLLQPMLLCQQRISHGFAPQLVSFAKLTETVVTGWMDGCLHPRSKSIPSWVKNLNTPVNQSLVAGKSTTCTDPGKTPKKPAVLQQKRVVFTFLLGKFFSLKLHVPHLNKKNWLSYLYKWIHQPWVRQELQDSLCRGLVLNRTRS